MGAAIDHRTTTEELINDFYRSKEISLDLIADLNNEKSKLKSENNFNDIDKKFYKSALDMAQLIVDKCDQQITKFERKKNWHETWRDKKLFR